MSVIISPSIFAADAAPPTEEDIRRRVLQLGASEYRDRKRAESALEKMGSAAIEVLQENSSHENLEIKIRVQRLIGDLRSQFIQQAVPDDLKEAFAGYENKSFAVRKAKLDSLKEKNLEGRIPEGRIRLLARLARFEESDLLAKQAALTLMNGDLATHPDGIEAAKKEMLEGIELSRRRPSQWIRLFANAESDARATVSSFRKLIELERADLKRFDKGTEQEIVEDLLRFLVRLQIDMDMRQDAVTEIKAIMAGKRMTAPEALEFWDWLEELNVPAGVEAFREEHNDVVAGDAVLLYRLAKFYDVQGDKETSRELADKAFDLKGAIVGHAAHFRSRVGVLSLDLENEPSDLESFLLKNPGDEAARRYFMAVLLDDEIGQLEWAEREYRAVIGEDDEDEDEDGDDGDGDGDETDEDEVDQDADEEPGSERDDVEESDASETEKDGAEEKPEDLKVAEMKPYQARACYNFAEMLHDLQREKEGALLLQKVVDECDGLTANQVEDLIGGRSLGAIESRMHYFYASDAANREEYDEQREHLERGIEAYSKDVDVLIGMFRSKNASEKWRSDTKRRIETVIQKFDSDLKTDRKMLSDARVPIQKKFYTRRVAFRENQYAWLVGNTLGDIDEAIRCSEHSLEVYPGDGGHLDTLGRCYYRKGDFESAIKYQRMAVLAAPHELQIQRQLQLIESEAPADLLK